MKFLKAFNFTETFPATASIIEIVVYPVREIKDLKEVVETKRRWTFTR